MSDYRFHPIIWHKLSRIIFDTDTPAGKGFDVALIYAIFFSVGLVMLSTVEGLSAQHNQFFNITEWVFTSLFTIEYILRLYSTPNPGRYFRSFYGLVDLVSILPSYINFIFGGGGYLIVVRLLRVLRIFRVLKLVRYVKEGTILTRALISSRHKIFVFICIICILTSIFGSLMYAIEGPENGFTSIPRGIYWAMVTITTVGYGDVVPQTVLGQAIAALTMVMGYAIVAVPTGIITAGIAAEMAHDRTSTKCRECNNHGNETDAQFCKYCGVKLN